VGNRLSAQVNSAVTTSTYNEKNQLVSSAGGGPLRVRGILDEPGTAKVNGVPASMVSGNAFEATIQATTGTNTFTVEATDYSGNVNTKSYSVTATGTGATLTYDANGNLTQKVEGGVTWTYVWDAENRLKWVCDTTPCTQAASVASFEYDPLGRRVEKVAGGVTTSFAYDSEDILRQITGSSVLKHVHGPGIDEPLAEEDATGALRYLHADGLGSLVKTTSSTGAILSSRRYNVLGAIELGAANGYGFTGREWDSEAELGYYRARYYDPKIGGFISEDPIRWFGGLNLYSYADEAPTLYSDPFGLEAGTAFNTDWKAAGGRWDGRLDPVNDLGLRRPDFYALGCQLGNLTAGTVVVPGASTAMGNVGGGTFGCGCFATANWMNQTGTPDPSEVVSLNQGPAVGGGGFKGVGAQVIVNPIDGRSATGMGFGWGGWGGGGSWGFSLRPPISPNDPPCDDACIQRFQGLRAMSKK
jgi:RHS repeat-associated protein